MVAKNIQLVLKTIESKDDIALYEDSKKYGRLRFPKTLNKVTYTEDYKRESEPIVLVPWDTFILPGVDQAYSFVTAAKQETEFLHIHAQFEYAHKPKAIQKAVLKLSRKIGLIQYSLERILLPHSVQKSFNLKMSTEAKK